jgi:hypothetical protein
MRLSFHETTGSTAADPYPASVTALLGGRPAASQL